MDEKKRNIGVDILKFMAVLLITNSHMEVLYGPYSVLATGGAIGDVLFFFCSGYTLFLRPMEGIGAFPNWYKRRINRIYPSVFAAAIVSCAITGTGYDIIDLIRFGGGWFVACIMVYYVIVYFIGCYVRKYTGRIIGMVSAVAITCFLSTDRQFPYNLYGDDGIPLVWIIYFNFMLLGAMMGTKPIKTGKSWTDFLLFIISVILFYALYISARKVAAVEVIEILSFLPLMSAVYFLFRWSNGVTARRIYTSKLGFFIIRFVGGLCLEVYLTHGLLLTDRLNGLFPLNIPIVFIAIVIFAYLVRCLSRFLSQTFKDAPYDWQQMVQRY